MTRKLYVAESRSFKTYGHSPAEARRKHDEFFRNPLLRTPKSRLGDPAFQPPDLSNVGALVRVREATEQEMHDQEMRDAEDDRES